MTFSQRFGLSSVRTAIQGRALDASTRNRLWSAFAKAFPIVTDPRSPFNRTWLKPFYERIWSDCWKLPVDEVPAAQAQIHAKIKQVMLGGAWYAVYDLLEFVLLSPELRNQNGFRDVVSRILTEEMAGFQWIANGFVEITDETEIAAIEEAFASTATNRFAPAYTHLGSALQLMSNRTDPDYRNSIKEAVSAVEAIVQILSGDRNAELGVGLRLLEKNAPLHGALRSSLRSLYGYASDGDGIRHALTEETNLDAADAKFMLVVCSAFVVYLIQHAAQ